MLITVAAFTRPWNAHLLRGRLEVEGIFAIVAHEQHLTVDWPLTLALGGAKVQVSSVDLERARGVMQRVESGDYAVELAGKPAISARLAVQYAVPMIFRPGRRSSRFYRCSRHILWRQRHIGFTDQSAAAKSAARDGRNNL